MLLMEIKNIVLLFGIVGYLIKEVYGVTQLYQLSFRTLFYDAQEVEIRKTFNKTYRIKETESYT